MEKIGNASESVSGRDHRQARGFLLPMIGCALKYSYDKLSLCALLNRLVDKPWTSEAYVVVVLAVGMVWLVLISQPVFTGPVWTLLGVGAALYWILELFVFALKWLLVDRGHMVSCRRSLICLFLNMVQVAVLFTILFWLMDAYDPPVSRYVALYRNLGCVLTPSLAEGLRVDSLPVQVLAHLQLSIAWVLVVLVFGNVVGAIDRGELDDVQR